MLNAEGRRPNVQESKPNAQTLKRRLASSCLYMNEKRLTPNGKPYDIHERLLEFIAKNRIALKGRSPDFAFASVAKPIYSMRASTHSCRSQTNWSESSPRSYTTRCGIVRSGAPRLGSCAGPDDGAAPTTTRTLNLEPRAPLGIGHYALGIRHVSAFSARPS